MISFRFKNVCLESFGLQFPETEVTSAELEDKIAPIYQSLQIPFGTLERLSGVKTRRIWPREILPSVPATVAAREALEISGFKKEQIGAVINCSVSRDYFEPATGCIIHNNLELPENAFAYDITNACIGFSDGMIMLAHLIEAGTVKAGIVVSGENISTVLETTIETMLKTKDLGRDQMLTMLPTLTLGCGAVAVVMCHESLSQHKHRFLGGVARSATQHHDLCSGNGDFCIGQGLQSLPVMTTDSVKLISSAAKLGGRAWQDATVALGWKKEDIHHVFCHQVGRQVNDGFYKEMGLDYEKDYAIYRQYGNMVSAAVPVALALGVKEKPVKKGEKVLLTAFGSGLNTRFLGLEW